jgi:hypothetical protein
MAAMTIMMTSGIKIAAGRGVTVMTMTMMTIEVRSFKIKNHIGKK